MRSAMHPAGFGLEQMPKLSNSIIARTMQQRRKKKCKLPFQYKDRPKLTVVIHLLRKSRYAWKWNI